MKHSAILSFTVLAGCVGAPETGSNPSADTVAVPGACSQIAYHGGHVIAHAKIQNIFWGSYWDTPVGATLEASVDEAWRVIGNNRAFYSPLAQYGAAPGHYLGAVANHGDPPADVYDTDVHDMLQVMMWFGVIPMNDPDTLYVVYLPQGTTSHPDLEQGWGGHHDSFVHGGNGQPVYYATITPMTQINRLTLVSSHEVDEAIADPGVSTGLGWDEVGDPCETLSPRGFRLDGYLLERVYSNADCGCVTTVAQPFASRHDLVWTNPTTTEVVLWQLDGVSTITATPTIGTAGSDWRVAGTGDLDGDGNGDIVWQNTTTGEVQGWLVGNGAVITREMPEVGGTIVAVGDFDGDGLSDVLWRIDLTGDYTISFSGARASQPPPFGIGIGMQVIGSGDFDGDRRTDLLLRSAVTGEVVELLLDGTVRARVSLGVVASDTTFIGIGDFNGDGTSDLLWRSRLGALTEWFMSAGPPVYGTLALATSTRSQIAAIADIDGDGKDDLVWRNVLTGAVSVWLVSSSTVLATGSPGSLPFDWTLAGTVADPRF